MSKPFLQHYAHWTFFVYFFFFSSVFTVFVDEIVFTIKISIFFITDMMALPSAEIYIVKMFKSFLDKVRRPEKI